MANCTFESAEVTTTEVFGRGVVLRDAMAIVMAVVVRMLSGERRR